MVLRECFREVVFLWMISESLWCSLYPLEKNEPTQQKVQSIRSAASPKVIPLDVWMYVWSNKRQEMQDQSKDTLLRLFLLISACFVGVTTSPCVGGDEWAAHQWPRFLGAIQQRWLLDRVRTTDAREYHNYSLTIGHVSQTIEMPHFCAVAPRNHIRFPQLSSPWNCPAMGLAQSYEACRLWG